jgi:N-acetylglutamate synthase-like GNAT family acetyltransferase
MSELATWCAGKFATTASEGLSLHMCRQGIAGKLMQRCEALARQDGSIDAIALHCDPRNLPAMHLYKELGFQTVLPNTGSPWRALCPMAQTEYLVMVKPLRDVMLTGSGNHAEAW